MVSFFTILPCFPKQICFDMYFSSFYSYEFIFVSVLIFRVLITGTTYFPSNSFSKTNTPQPTPYFMS
ncbi:hypothetical protein B9Z55_002701 [Caenorhabditis nigoni]|uniref:Uncharacterized protein n=1 Tax=Caenorhabditis nigoni TaxID=1611254 RepID=A0A2G5VM04_9PELO|nr:hypothetical protein B9Z55_002701 [Caenorhabditis nigoni]